MTRQVRTREQHRVPSTAASAEDGRSWGPGSTRTLARLAAILLVATIAAVPLLVPPFGANATPADVVNVGLIVLGTLFLWRTRGRVELPLAGPWLLFVLGGAVALPQSIDPRQSALAIVQDLYLFLWFLVVVNLLARNPTVTPETFSRVWIIVSFMIALAICGSLLAYPEHVPVIFGWETVSRVGRATATFRDPNLAGNYLVLSLFVLLATPRFRIPWIKSAFSIPLALGIGATYSITALGALVAGAITTLTLQFAARRQLGIPVALVVIGATVLLLAAPRTVPVRALETFDAIASKGPFQGSLGRADISAKDRLRRWQEATYLFGGDLIVGIGPASTPGTLVALDAPITGELHNDYVAAFVERGVLGGIGLLSLLWLASVRTVRLLSNKALLARGWCPPALMGGVVAIAVSAITLETLHFRHVWLFLGLTSALGIDAVNRAPTSATRPPIDSRAPTEDSGRLGGPGEMRR